MMRHIAVSVFVLGAGVALSAQPPLQAPRLYDAASEVTYGGVITTVLATTGPDGTVGVHVELAIGRGKNVMVHLGPAMFIGSNDAFFNADDQVLVTGAFVSHDGEVALWARQISTHGKTLTLRGPDGTPRWLYATADDPDGCGVSHAVVRD